MRLSKEKKEQIFQYIVREAFTSRVEALQEFVNQQARKWLVSQITTAEKKWIEAAPPKAGLLVRESMIVILPGESRRFLTGDLHQITGLRTYSSFEARFLGVTVPPRLNHVHPDNGLADLRKGRRSAMSYVDDMRKDYDLLKSTVRPALNACTTEKQLKERYPQLHSVYIRLFNADSDTKNLPAVTNSEIESVIKKLRKAAGGAS